VLSTSVPTNQYGLTTVLATANHIAGSYNVTATFGSLTPVTFTLTNNPPPAYVVTTALDDAAGTPANCPAGNSPSSANCSLRDALAAAATNNVGSITFDSGTFNSSMTAAQNTIALGSAGTLNVPPNTTITGPTTGGGYTLANLVTVAGGGLSSNFPVFTVNNDLYNDLTDGAVIANLTITQGNSGLGGGIAIGYGSVLLVTNCTISGNTSTGGAAAIFNDYNSVLTVTGSTITGNTGDNYGGIVNEGGGTVTVNSSTISNNTGQAILNAGILLAVNASTISGNAGFYGGGGINNDSGVVTLANSIVAGNTAISGGDINGSYTDSGGNIVGGVNGVTASNINLATLAPFGGPTQTQLPLPGSVAICAGLLTNANAAGLSTDQRGQPLDPNCPSGSVDSGAVQTSYLLSFTSSFSSSYPGGPPLSPAIPVELTESGVAATAVTSPVTMTDSDGTLIGTTSVALSAGMASFTNLILPTVETSDTLTATIPLNPSLTPPLYLRAKPSPSFQVTNGNATLTYPTTGPLGVSQLFTWQPGAGDTQYQLRIGSTGVGSSNLYFGPDTYNTSVMVNNLPRNGETIYVRLFSLKGGSWLYNDYTFTAFTGTPATLSYPTTPTIDVRQLFTWQPGVGVTQYSLRIGSTGPGSSDLYYGPSETTDTSVTINNLPHNGENVYVRLFSLTGGFWLYKDYNFFAFTGTPATLNPISGGTTLSGPTQIFTWDTGVGVTQYALRVGSTGPGSTDVYYGSDQTTNLSASVPYLPTNGETLYVRLFSLTGGFWLYNDYTFTAFTGTPATLNPISGGTTLSGATQIFTWNAGVGVTQYSLRIGSTGPGSTDLYYGPNQSTNLSATVTRLPVNGETVYVRLFSLTGGTWLYNDYTFTAYH